MQEEIKEQERKYQNNEDFTYFLREPAQKRKIANLFTSMKRGATQRGADSTSKQDSSNPRPGTIHCSRLEGELIDDYNVGVSNVGAGGGLL